MSSREKGVPIDKEDLEKFLQQVLTLSDAVENRSHVVTLFG